MKTLKEVMLCLFLAAATMVAFTGCQTAQGFGEDMEDAGEEIQEEVN